MAYLIHGSIVPSGRGRPDGAELVSVVVTGSMIADELGVADVTPEPDYVGQSDQRARPWVMYVTVAACLSIFAFAAWKIWPIFSKMPV